MAITITVGNAIIEKDDYAGYYVIVEDVKLSEAPCFEGDEDSWNINSRSPSHNQWFRIIDISGLHEAYKEGGFMYTADGNCKIIPLTEHHVVSIENAIKSLKENYPGSKARIGIQYSEVDGVLCRLEWLAWWIKWALKNCEFPALDNDY